ncbi:MAG TPA: HAD hydrolase-like protein [Acidobacteriaceae bacterium]
MVPRLLVFDLDGTLIDSQIDLSNSINAMLEHLGKPVLPHEVISGYIGDGANMLVRRALGDPEGDVHDAEYVERALTYFLDYYRAHKLDFTYVYEGVFDALAEIRREYPGIPMAVLTNKPVRPSRDICAHFALDRFFFQNYGGNSFHTKKPDPTGLLTLIAEASEMGRAATPITAAETVMIGDSDVDVLTARNCGALAVGCAYGLSPHGLAAARPDAVANAPADWPASLRLLAEATALR